MDIRHDHAGNQFMTLAGTERDRPRVIVGSHMDSVDHGGNFDGAAGVILGLAAASVLAASGVRRRCDLTVMAIRAEELVWFPTPYCGSRMAFGLLPAADYERLARSDTGRSLAAHMREGGWNPDALMAGAKGLDPTAIAAFIEPHIEQGPILEAAGEPVGIVTGIRGSLRYRHGQITGRWAHAGAVPRAARHDAVRAGAALVCALEAIWDAHDAAGADFVATVGEFGTDPALHAMTKVPGDVRFTLDLRSLDSAVLARTRAMLDSQAQRISEQFGVEIDLGAATSAPPALCDGALRARLADAARGAGVAHRLMASGAGHDCATFAAQGVPSAMLFIRNQNGSHNPDEAMAMDDFAAALRVLTLLLKDVLCD